MKSTVTVNLNERLFYIDSDAHAMLDNYIKSLNSYFAKDISKSEIIDDFEGRIQELFISKKPNIGDVITIADVEEVIKIIGNPRDFDIDAVDGQDTTDKREKINKSGYDKKPTKKLYRNPNDKMIGGVCGGVAAFFNIDATLIRIIVFILAFFSIGSLILIYLILWILVPEAKTASQQLEMKGEQINLENIGRVISENAQNVANNIKNIYNNNNSCLFNLIKIVLIIIGAIIIIPLIVACLIMIFLCFNLIETFFAQYCFINSNISVISLGLVFGIPVIIIIYSILSAIFKWRGVSKSIKLTGLLIWIVSLIIFIFTLFTIDWISVRNSKWRHNIIKTVIDNVWCNSESYNKISGNGNIITRTFECDKDITAISIKNDIEAVIEKDPDIKDMKKVTVTTDENILDNMNINLDNNRIKISYNSKLKLRPSNRKIIIKVHDNVWENIDMSGSSELYIYDKWQTSNAVITLRGASDITANQLEAGRVYFNFSGTSKAGIDGKANYTEYDISGASIINNQHLAADSVKLDASGASEITINPLIYLKGNLSGASKVEYCSEPTAIKEISTSGASKVIKRDL